MDKNMIKKTSSIVLIALAVVLIISTFFRSDDSAIIGKWELAPSENYGIDIYEFYKDNTGVRYDVQSDGDAYDSETFSYRLYDSKITLSYGTFGVSRVYSYDLSGKNLLVDGKLYCKAGGSSVPWIRYMLAILFLALTFVLQKTDINNLIENVKRGKLKPIISKATKPSINKTPPGNSSTGRLRSTMRTVSSTSSETAERFNGFNSDGEL